MKILNRIKYIALLVFLPIVVFISLVVLTSTFSTTPARVYAIGTVLNLGTAEDFAVLAGAAVTGTNTNVVNGNVGLSPTGGTGITSLPCTEVNGTIYDTNGGYDGNGGGLSCLVTNAGLLTTAKSDLSLAYNDAEGQGSDTVVNASTTDSFADTGYTLGPGVYTSGSSMGVPLALTLDGGGNADAVFIFQAGTTLTTVSNSVITLTGSAQACNVFWQVGTSTILGTTSTFKGTIMAAVSITDNGFGNVNGRLLADADNTDADSTGAVTLNNTTINVPTCAAATPTPTPTPTAAPTATPTPTPTSAPTATPTPTPTSTSSSSSSSSNSSSSTGTTVYPALANSVIVPTIIESRRVDADSIFISWGPYSGVDTFNVQYGLESGKWPYNTNVTGFSTTINSLPLNQPIYVRVAARNTGTIGTYGEAKLIGGGPKLSNAGFAPHKRDVSWYIPVGIPMLSSFLLKLISI